MQVFLACLQLQLCLNSLKLSEARCQLLIVVHSNRVLTLLGLLGNIDGLLYRGRLGVAFLLEIDDLLLPPLDRQVDLLHEGLIVFIVFLGEVVEVHLDLGLQFLAIGSEISQGYGLRLQLALLLCLKVSKFILEFCQPALGVQLIIDMIDLALLLH